MAEPPMREPTFYVLAALLRGPSRARRTSLPIGRVGTLEEVAGTILWLATPASGFVVGHDLVLDGGATA